MSILRHRSMYDMQQKISDREYSGSTLHELHEGVATGDIQEYGAICFHYKGLQESP